MNTSKPNIALRLALMLLDHLIMCFVLVLPILALNLLRYDSSNANGFGGIIQLALVLLLVLYFLKDSFDGRSLVKRITKFQVVDNITGEAASVGRCFIRNVFVIMWPVEVPVSLLNTQRRIGDFVAGTKVVRYSIPAPVKVEEF